MIFDQIERLHNFTFGVALVPEIQYLYFSNKSFPVEQILYESLLEGVTSVVMCFVVLKKTIPT